MKILFIDSIDKSLTEVAVLFKQHGCKTALTADPLQALKLLSKHKFDVVITADKLEKTSVFNLLKAISIKFAAAIRITIQENEAISKRTDNYANSSIKQVAHYVFEQPLDNRAILATVMALKDSCKAINKDVIVKAVAAVKTLPSPPKVYLQLNAILKNSSTDSEKIAEIISQDPALVAKVLQFSNNAFMQNGKPLTNISDAITKMGVDTLSCIVMTAELFSYQPDIPNFSIVEEQLHSLATARFAATLVDVKLKQDALLAGLLHDIGKLVLFEVDKALTLKYFANQARTSGGVELEKRIFSTDHSQVGAYLLHIWSFPYHIIDAVLLHHNESKLMKSKFGIAQAVYLANSLLKDQEPSPEFIKHFALTNKLDKLKNKAAKFQ